MNIRHAVRDIIVAKFTYLGIAWAYRAWVSRRGPLTRIVVFHDVPDRAWFETMIATLISETRVLTPEEFMNGERDTSRINTLITFDDGYASWVDVALPVLESKKLKAIFFINSGLLEAAQSAQTTKDFMRESLRINPRMPLTWGGAAELQNHGHTIGGHARMHQNLALLRQEESFEEIISDKQALESKLGVTIIEFAYPFGTRAHFTKETISAVQRVGYERAYTAISRFVKQSSIESMSVDAVRGEKRILGASQDLEHSYAKGLPYPVGYSEDCDQSVSKSFLPAFARKSEDKSSLPLAQLAVDCYSAGANERSNTEMRHTRRFNDETFAIPRMCIEDGLTSRKLSQWLRGAYDLFDMLKSLCVR